MKNSIKIFLMLFLLATLFSCQKDRLSNSTVTPTNTDNYSSVANFFKVNASPMQSYSIDGTNGGTFTTPNGTIVAIPAYAFMTQNYQPVTGNVTILFKDIYKKSDMLLNDISTNLFHGGPLKSAGMFYIKAMQGNQAVLLSFSNKITITQPLNGLAVDQNMVALILNPDTATGWVKPLNNKNDTLGMRNDTLNWTTTNYVFNMYQFSSPVDSGSWCNSDNCTYFSAYPQTTLTLNPLDDINVYNITVFLIFSSVNSMVHVYSNGSDFPYNYAPLGLQCTVVAIGTKDKKLYSSFTPITITNNLTVNFSLTETTTADFIAKLKLLD